MRHKIFMHFLLPDLVFKSLAADDGQTQDFDAVIKAVVNRAD
jgi:hypothetical protein